MDTLDDDLTIIRGIGAATAAKLRREGIRTFAQLAAVTDPLRPALDKLGSADEWKWWRKAAQKEVDRAIKESGERANDATGDAPGAGHASEPVNQPGNEEVAGTISGGPPGKASTSSPPAFGPTGGAPAKGHDALQPEPSAGGPGTDTRAEMMVRIVSKREGFRRGGLTHSRKPIEHRARALTPEQMTQLVAEPVLSIELVFENGKRFAVKEWPPTAAHREEIIALGGLPNA